MGSGMNQTTMIAALRGAGLPMRGRQQGAQIGYTTSRELAEKAREIGARVHGDRAPTPRGWEIVVPPDPPADTAEQLASPAPRDDA